MSNMPATSNLFDPNADLSQRIAYDVNGNAEYIGKAMPGTLTSAAAWQIKKCVYDVNNNIVSVGFPGGDNSYLSVWDDRATYSYA